MNILIDFILRAFAITFAITIHEYTKAAVSTKLGDPSPGNNGRLTLNFIKHLEPIGFICMFIFNCGWGKPVPTSALYYKDPKRDTIITYTLPGIINLIIGICFSVILFMMQTNLSLTNTLFSYLIKLFNYLAIMNVSLAVFNIIPVYPLDAAKVLSVCVSPNNAVKLSANEKILQIILILLIIVGVIPGFVGMVTNSILYFVR